MTATLSLLIKQARGSWQLDVQAQAVGHATQHIANSRVTGSKLAAAVQQPDSSAEHVSLSAVALECFSGLTTR